MPGTGEGRAGRELWGGRGLGPSDNDDDRDGVGDSVRGRHGVGRDDEEPSTAAGRPAPVQGGGGHRKKKKGRREGGGAHKNHAPAARGGEEPPEAPEGNGAFPSGAGGAERAEMKGSSGKGLRGSMMESDEGGEERPASRGADTGADKAGRTDKARAAGVSRTKTGLEIHQVALAKEEEGAAGEDDLEERMIALQEYGSKMRSLLSSPSACPKP
ncbi:hypothetical protein T484DRAFT_1847396 [Baffinella frigidus]|nr:hypothetical protein T484DRAFT_1847396 [Cryptophyta sp. CCMP2293]